MQKLMNVYGLSQEETARKLGMAQSTLSNKLRLLRLPEEIRRILEQEQLTERHARALLRLETTEQMKEALDHIASKKLNVSQSEKLIEQFLKTQIPLIFKKTEKGTHQTFQRCSTLYKHFKPCSRYDETGRNFCRLFPQRNG